MSVPEIQLIIPLEGTPMLYVLADSDEDARALLVHLEQVDFDIVALSAAHRLEQLRKAA